MQRLDWLLSPKPLGQGLQLPEERERETEGREISDWAVAIVIQAVLPDPISAPRNWRIGFVIYFQDQLPWSLSSPPSLGTRTGQRHQHPL